VIEKIENKVSIAEVYTFALEYVWPYFCTSHLNFAGSFFASFIKFKTYFLVLLEVRKENNFIN